MDRPLTPEQLNPLDLNPLRDIVAEQFDFARLRRESTVRLFIAATHANTGQLRLFRNAELSADPLLASACLPTIHRTVVIDGEPYWDGGYSANPAVFPLAWECSAADPRMEETRLFRIPSEPGKPKIYCIEHPYFDRTGLYGESGMDYADNLHRWAFFCRAALESLPRVARSPLVLHCYDWHTALAPVYLRTYHADQPFARGIRSVLTVHNAGFQGHFPASGVPEIGLPWELYTWQHLEWHDKLNLLKGGLKFADAATTVSPTHAHEQRTPVGGFGLHDVFLWLGERFTGIVNGIDTAALGVEVSDGAPRNGCTALYGFFSGDFSAPESPSGTVWGTLGVSSSVAGAMTVSHLSPRTALNSAGLPSKWW